MAILNLDKQLEIDQAWEGQTGNYIEDLITRHLPVSMDYESESAKLSIRDYQGNTIVSTDVSVAVPQYTHTISIVGLYFDNTNSENQINKETIVCKLGTKIYLAVKYIYTATNTITNITNHITNPQKLEINIGQGYQKLESGIVSSNDIQYIDITDVYSKVTISNIQIRATASASFDDKIVTASTSKQVQVVNPIIKYSDSSYIVGGTVNFSIQDGGTAKYLLYYTLNSSSIRNQEGTTIMLDNSGLNSLEVYVQSQDNSSIKSESLKVQVINTPNNDTFDRVLYAVNEVVGSVNNWEFTKLYKISIYYKGIVQEEPIQLTTKLTETANYESYYLNKTKEIELTNQNTYIETDVSYFLGLSSTSTSFSSALFIEADREQLINGEDTIVDIINSGSYSYTPNCSYYFDQYSPEQSNIITKQVINKTISPDGLITEDALSIFRLSAGNYPNGIINLDLSNQLTTQGFTFELDFKTYNLSNESKPIIKLGRFILYANEFNWQYGDVDESLVDTTAKSSIFREDVRTHLLVEIVPNFKAPSREIPNEVKSLSNKTLNLVRVFINNGIDREYKYDYLTDFNYNGFNLEINPEAADIDIYGIRVYNRALTLAEIQANYVSTISSISEKESFERANDLVSTDSNGDTYISYKKTKELYNTLVYIMPKGKPYPNQFNLVKGGSIKGCTVFINYVNSEFTDTDHILTEEQINRCSGRFTNAAISGQGTSAMKYYWYNIQMKKPTFTSQGCYDEATNEYVKPIENPNNYQFNSSKYYMPEDTECKLGINKLCGKFNYASSMQSHKIGAVKAFHDLWNSCVDKSDFTTDEIKGRKACLEDTFIAFYIETDVDDLTNYKLSDINQLNDEDIKFAGFQTWGSAKGDKNTFGYSDNTPGYILLEGAENDGTLCNWLAPWSPSIAQLDGETWKTKYLVTNGDSVSYALSDSFDVDFGLDDNDASGNTMSEAGNETLQAFIKAYNFAYMHTINLLPYKETYSLNDSRNSGLDINKKYYITSINYQDNTYFKGQQWDVFRYDTYSKLWVPAGLPVLNDDGSQKLSTIRSAYNTDVYEYEVFNLKKFHQSLGTSGVEKIDTYINDLKTDFKNHFNEYFHAEDIIYHQAFIRLFAGTDNRAKNTYFKLFSKDSRIQMLQDDLDTILATDNRGLQKKPYFLLEPSLESDSTYQEMWGGISAFFELVDIAYKEEIDNMLLKMLSQMNFLNTTSSLDTWMTKYFYYVQKYYPSVTFNYVARLAYESAQIFFDNQAEAGITWTNNGQSPLSQEHGSCLESEIGFMRKRLIMFLSQAKIAMFGREGSGIPIKTKEDTQDSQEYKVKITPSQYLYLGYLIGSTSNLFSNKRIAAGEEYEVTINIPKGTPSYYVLGGQYIQKFDNFKNVFYNQGEYSLNAPKLLEFSANTGTSSNPLFQPPSLVLNTNVLEKLDLTNVKSLNSINLDSNHTPKLKEVILTGTNIQSVSLPTGARLTTIHYPASLTDLTITDNEGLTDVQFESLVNLQTIKIDGSKIGQFDLSAFCEELINCSNLTNIVLTNVNISITQEALNKLLSVNSTITGIVNVVDNNKDLVEISFTTKDSLVKKFGNIDSNSNKLKVNYKASTTLFGATCDPEVTIFGVGEKGTGLFNLQVNSNQVDIITDNTGTRLHIDYTISSTRNVDIIKETGAITLKSESSETPIVTISIYQKGNNNPVTVRCTLRLQWKAPDVGNFIYADGSYSSNYNINKTLIGLIYAVNNKTTESGTAYIIGKENFTDKELYLGFTPQGNVSSEASQTLKDLGYIGNILQNWQLITNSTEPSSGDYSNMVGVSNNVSSSLNNITYKTYTDFSITNFVGKEDTKIYVNGVSKVLAKLLANYNSQVSNYISTNSEGYCINSMSDLLNLVKNLKLANVQTEEVSSCVIFPYFYAAYLYEPKVNSNETLNSQFTKNNWYVPSVNQLARVIYYRGYSTRGDDFAAPASVSEAISDQITSGTELNQKAIFSDAYRAMSSQVAFPIGWSNLVNFTNSTSAQGNNITTTVGSTQNNYSYQITYTDYNQSETTAQWMEGAPITNSYWSQQQLAAQNAWRLTKHIGLPFTQFNYSKNA